MSRERNSPKQPSAGVLGRIEAARRLVRIQDEGAFASLVGGDSLVPGVERVATLFVGGVTRWRRWLDHLVAGSYRGDPATLEPMLREILRIGALDLAVLDTAPHAAVHQAVEAARTAIRHGAGGLVNAVLRAIERKRADWSIEPGDDVRSMAVRYSHPDWMVKRWRPRFGVDATRKLLAHNNKPPVFGLRVARDTEAFEAFLAEEGIVAEPSPYLEDYRRLTRLQPIVRGGWLERGACAVQDESAGLVVALLDPQSGEHVVDACAAPGGKARYITERMGTRGTLDAVDASETRLGLLRTGSRGVDVRVHAANFQDWALEHQGVADRVLVDAPCTGLGVLSSRADLRWRRSPEDFGRLIPIQRDLLQAAASVVKPGGVLVYSTCSIAPEENQAQVEWFLAHHPEFTSESGAVALPAATTTRDGFLETLPQVHGIDGAFGARFRRSGP